MNKEKQELLLEKVKKKLNNLCYNFDNLIKKIELKVENEETMRDIIYHYVGKENIISLDIYTDENGTML